MTFTRLCFGLFLTFQILFGFSAKALAACSSDLGDATINEVANNAGGADKFIEVKILDPGISTLFYRLELCADTGTGKNKQECETIWVFWDAGNTNVPSNYPWLTYEGDEDFDGDKLDFKDGFSIALLDAGGNAIDLLEVNGYSGPDYNCNSFIYDTDISGTNNGSKSIHRIPDGTGDWEIQQSNNVDETPGGDNEDNGGGAAVAHYAIQTISPALTCEAGQVTIEPHDSSDTAIPANGTTITLSTDIANDGWVLITGSGSLVGNQYTFANDETSVVLGLHKLSAAILDIDVTDGSATDQDGVAEDDNIEFVDVAVRFYNDANADGDADGSGNDLPNLIAGVLYDQGIIRVIGSDPDTGECVSALNSAATLPVQMAYECNDPVSCIRDKDLEIAGVAIEENNSGSVADYETVNLAFDTGGEAPFSIEYFDAGEITLHALLDIPAIGDTPALSSVSGSSNRFVVKPADLVITDIPGNPGTTSTGSAFVAAGENFTVQVTALNDDGDTTPNFGRENTPHLVELIFNGVTFPDVGSPASGLLSGNGFVLTATAAVLESSVISWDEVGSFTAYAHIEGSDYLGAGDVTGSVSGDIGRFYPDYFDLSASSLSNSCSGFTYLSQPAMGVSYTLEAHKQGGGVVSNYDNTTLNYPVTATNHIAEHDNDGVDLSSRLNVDVSGFAWNSGQYQVSVSDASLDRDSGLEGVLDSLVLGVQISDALDSRDFAMLDMNAATSGDCSDAGDCDARALSGSLMLRFGRLYTKDVHGPESAALPVILQAEYWNGSSWQLNTDDSCTSFGRALIEFNGNTIVSSLDVDFFGNSDTDTTGTFIDLDASNMTLSGGDAGLVFTAPGAGKTGSFPVDVDTSGMDWLKFDWDQDGSHDDDLPTATVTFGSYRGHDRVIYWQERLAD